MLVRGKRHWLWRAVDNEGEELDFPVQPKRNTKAALKLMRKLLKKQGWATTWCPKSGNILAKIDPWLQKRCRPVIHAALG